MDKKRKRILIVNVNWLGDVLFSTAAIKAIRKKYPKSFIACMVVPRCKDILEDNPGLDEVIIYDEAHRHKGIMGKLKFILFLKRRDFDTVFCFHRSFTRLLLCFLAGISERIGYYRKKGGYLLTEKVEISSSIIHRAGYFLNLIREAGIEAEDKNCEFFISEEAKKSMSNFLKEENVKKGDFLVVLNPGGNWHLKRWPSERFAELADRLIKRYGAKIIITGSPIDVNLAQDLMKKMKNAAINASGRTTLKELAALLKFADLVISADTGPTHIAVSVQTPVVALFGPTSLDITGPYTDRTSYRVIQKDVGCPIPCYNLDCKNNRCMQEITVEDVMKAVEDLNIYPFK